MVVCGVAGCRNRSDNGRGLSFYRLPLLLHEHDSLLAKKYRKTDRRKLWLMREKPKCGALEDNIRICKEHFVTGTCISIQSFYNSFIIDTDMMSLMGHAWV